MRSFRRNKNGQFIIISALIIAVFTLSLVSSISQVAQKRQEFKHEPVQENVLNLLSDFERCITRALARATQTYNESGDINNAKSASDIFIEDWIKSAIASYQNIGLKVKSVTALPSLEWWIEGSSSSITAQFKVDVDAYGIKNLNIRTGKRVELRMISCEKNGLQCNLYFRAIQTGKQDVFNLEPIVNLESSLVNIKVVENKTETRDCTVTALHYLGDGYWNVTFTLPSDVSWDEVSRIKVHVTTEEDIMVAGAIDKEVSENQKDMTWSTLYLVEDKPEYLIVPFYDYNQRAAHIAPTINFGYVKKQPSVTLSFVSDPTPFDIELNDNVVLTLYVDATPAKSKKTIEVSFGYINAITGENVTISAADYENCGYTLGPRGTFKTACISNINSRWPWVIHFNVTLSQKEVPEGSKFWINITVYFNNEAGTVKIWMKSTGQSNPSTIHLYG